MLALPALTPWPVDLVLFPFGVPTGDAYAWLAATREGKTTSARALSPGELTTWESVTRLAHNDFEQVVGARFPAIRDALSRLRALERGEESLGAGPIALLAGSGSTVFRVRAPQCAAVSLESLGAGSGARVVETSVATRVVAVEVLG